MQTPEELIQATLKEWIYKEDHDHRLQNYQLYEAYYDGTFADEDVPKALKDVNLNQIISPRVREALESDFKVIANYAKTVVNKAVGYLTAEPISIEVKADLFGLEGEDKAEQRKQVKDAAEEAQRLLYRVYRDNDFLTRNIIKLVRMQGKKGDVFVKCWVDPNDKEQPIKLTILRPENVFIKFKSDNYEDKEYIAIIYTKYDEKSNPYKFAQVWWPDEWREYESRAGQDWKLTNKQPNEIGMIPIVHIKNMEDEKPWGESDIEVIRTLIDAMCKAFTDLMCNADYQAFQRTIVTGYEEPPETPGVKKSKPQTGPGSMLFIPGDGSGNNPEVTVVEAANPQGLINIIKTIREEISCHARVPQIAFSQADGAGQASSLSLRIHYQPLDEKCNEKAKLLSNALETINWIIFKYHKLLTREDFTNFETEVRFSKSLPVDRKEEQEIRDSQIRNKTLSRESAMKQEGIDDVEAEKERIRKEQEEEQQDLYNQRLGSDINSLLGLDNKDKSGGA